MFRVIMTKGRKLKKISGDLEAQKQNVASLEPITEQNVDPSEPKVDESNNPCDLKLAMVVICNSNDEIPPNTNWNFNQEMVGSIVLEFTYIKSNVQKKMYKNI